MLIKKKCLSLFFYLFFIVYLRNGEAKNSKFKETVIPWLLSGEAPLKSAVGSLVICIIVNLFSVAQLQALKVHYQQQGFIFWEIP